MRKAEAPIIVEQNFSLSKKTVWGAITELSQMKQWFFSNIPAFDPVVGFETRFNIQVEDRVFSHLWKLVEVVPMQKVVYDWRYEGYSGISIVAFELSEKGSQTCLKLTSTALVGFPSNVPEFTRKSGVEGWQYFINKSLKQFLEKKEF